MSNALDEIKKKNARDNKIFFGALAVGAAAIWQNAKEELRKEEFQAEGKRILQQYDEEVARGKTEDWNLSKAQYHLRQDIIRAGEVKPVKVKKVKKVKEAKEQAPPTLSGVIGSWILAAPFVWFLFAVISASGKIGVALLIAALPIWWAYRCTDKYFIQPPRKRDRKFYGVK